MGAFGDPRLLASNAFGHFKQEFPMTEFIGYFNQGGLVDHAIVKRSMERFAREVIPHCR